MAKDWDIVREDLRQLYHVDNQPLREVMRLMESKHGFIASERAYRTQLQKWGYMKYSTHKFPNPTRNARQVRRPNAMPSAASHLGHSIVNSTDTALLPSAAPALGNSLQPPPPPAHIGPSLIVPWNVPSNTGSYDNPQYPAPRGSVNSFSIADYAKTGKTPLHHAVIAQDKNQVTELLFRSKASVDVKDSSGNNPLHYAAQGGDYDIVALLLRFGADVHAEGELERQPLHLAIQHIHVVKELLNAGATLSCRDRNGDTPFHILLLATMSAQQRFSIIHVLLENECNLNAENKNIITPFLQFLNMSANYSEGGGCLVCVSKMLRKGADVMTLGVDGRPPFQIFLSNAKDHKYFSQDSYILHRELFKTVRSFLQRGASSWTLMSDSGEVSLLTYCFQRMRPYPNVFNDMSRMLCTLMKPDMVVNGTSALHETSAMLNQNQDSIEFAQILVRNGADPNCRNRDRSTPLLLAFAECRSDQKFKDFVLALIAMGADPWLSDRLGNCAFFVACRILPTNCAPTLIEILAMDIRNKERSNSNSGASETEDIRAVRDQWPEWADALTAPTWSQGKLALQNSCNSLPRDLDINVLRKMALTALAEKHLQRAKQGRRTAEQDHGSVLEILRDCRALHIVLDRKHYEQLLDICP